MSGREGVWLKMSDADLQTVLADHPSWFEDHDEACAVVLDGEDKPSQWLEANVSGRKLERALLNAERSNS